METDENNQVWYNWIALKNIEHTFLILDSLFKYFDTSTFFLGGGSC